MSYPSFETVTGADQVQLGTWLRFLPSPGVSDIASDSFSQTWKHEQDILNRIMERFNEMGGWTAEISKAVGISQS